MAWLWPQDQYPRLIPARRDSLGRWGAGWWPVSVIGLPSVDLESKGIPGSKQAGHTVGLGFRMIFP